MRALCVAVLTLTLGCGSSGGDAKDAAVGDGAALDAVMVDAGAVVDAAPADAARSCVDDLPAPVLVDPAVAPELAVVGDPGSAAGIFDPSVVYPLGAPGGAMSFLRGPNMTVNYGLCAVPAVWDVTGRNSFQITAAGVVYQRDLGQGGTHLTAFDPVPALWLAAE